MKKFLSLLLASFLVTSVYAADQCADRAAEKKLAGAAKNSFMKKCEADTKALPENAACQATAQEKKLAGAAKNSFMKKCVADAKAAGAK